MRRQLVIIVFSIALIAALSGCQKSWSCNCTKGAPSKYLSGDTKSQAITVCSNYENDLQAMYLHSTCSIDE